MAKPESGSYPEHFEKYISLVSEDNLQDAFSNQRSLVDGFFLSIPECQTNEGYAPGKWSLKELLQHIIDTERIFNYRALCFARNEKGSLPGFDESEYADNSNASIRTWESLCEELKIVRSSTEILFNSFSADVLNRVGMANNKQNTVLAVGFIHVGHLYHHIMIVKERYLKN